MGIFATAGGGKSKLMGMIADGAQADAVVVALIGERWHTKSLSSCTIICAAVASA